MSATLSNKNRLLEKYVQVVREDGLNTNKNVNIGINGGTGNLWVNGNITTSGTISGHQWPVVDVTASTLTLTQAQAGSTVLLDRAAGTTITLPAPLVGMKFTFIVPTSVTSNAYKIITNAGTVFILGQLDLPVAAGTAKIFYADGSTIVSINGNGSTTGGLAGSQFDLTCISSTLWNVEGTWDASGTVATPFANS